VEQRDFRSHHRVERDNNWDFCGAEIMMLERRLFRVLEFPKHLQTTVITLLKLGRATAEDVAKVTGKARAVESAYLNQLVVMKVVQKQRQGRKAFFMVDMEGLNW
jgi:hypothetical protein